MFLVFSDTLVLILGIVGACLLVLIIFVLLICVRRRAKGKESIHTKWMINCNEIAPADDTEDHPMVLGNLHHMNSSEGLVEPTYLFFYYYYYYYLFCFCLFGSWFGSFCLDFCNAFLSGIQLFELMLS